MKKIFAAALALICVLGLIGCSPMDNVPTLESVKEYSAEDFNEHFKGVNREGLIEVWGDPAGSLTEENADMWDIDDESMVVIYWKDNGKFESAGISIKENINNAGTDIADLSKTVKIEISCYNLANGEESETIAIAGEEDIKHICDNLNSLTLKKMENTDPTILEYELIFYDADGERLEVISIPVNNWIGYGGYFHSITDGELDRAFFAELIDIANSAGPKPAE